MNTRGPRKQIQLAPNSKSVTISPSFTEIEQRKSQIKILSKHPGENTVGRLEQGQ